MSGIGKHLATFNLFREADHSLHVTIAEARGVREELGQSGAPLHLCAMNALRVALLDPSQSERVSRLEEALREVLDLFDADGALFCSGEWQLEVIPRARAALNDGGSDAG